MTVLRLFLLRCIQQLSAKSFIRRHQHDASTLSAKTSRSGSAARPAVVELKARVILTAGAVTRDILFVFVSVVSCISIEKEGQLGRVVWVLFVYAGRFPPAVTTKLISHIARKITYVSVYRSVNPGGRRTNVAAL
jgi:hypothetical protein